MPSKKRKEQERRNLLKKASGNCKALEELFQNSNAKGKYYAYSEIKDCEPGTSRSNESVDGSDTISNTSKRDNATLKKDIETGCSAGGPGLTTKN